jgi:hypothetical protein
VTGGRAELGPEAAAAPTVVDGVLDLSRFATVARLHRGRATATAAHQLPANEVVSQHPTAGPDLVRTFEAALADAGLELDPDARKPRLTYGVSYTTRALGDTPTRYVTLLITAHVRLRTVPKPAGFAARLTRLLGISDAPR